jgi:ABC-2 type transport system ATP-binding protein
MLKGIDILIGMEILNGIKAEWLPGRTHEGDMNVLLEAQGIVKRYRGSPTPANNGVDISVEAGQVYGLLGHNGAGKTTLVNQVIGLLKPDAGTIRIAGRDAVADPGYARRVCSIQPQAQVPIAGLTPRQAIETLGRLRGGEGSAVRARTTELIEALALAEWADASGARLSGGVRRLVSFCMAAVEPGRLVILDEPTNDVDPVRRRLLWDQVRSLADGGAAVLLVTHNVSEAERSVDRLAILGHGRVLAEGTSAELKAGVADGMRLELVLDEVSATPARPPFATTFLDLGNRVVATLPTAAGGEAAVWAQTLRQARRIDEYTLGAATLEDAYIALAGDDEPAKITLEDTRERAA